MIWRTINLISYLTGLFVGIIILVGALLKYRKLRFTPFLIVAIGLGLIGSSFGFDIAARFLPPNNRDMAFIYLKFANLLFLFGSIITISCLFLVRIKIPWLRLIIYALFYGMAMELFIGDNYDVLFNSELEMWLIEYNKPDLQNILIILISMPMFDTIINIILRHRLGFATQSARYAVFYYWLGMSLPVIFIFYIIPNPIIDFAVSNLTLNLGFLCILFSFLREPLIFTLTNTKYYEIIIASPDEGDVAIGQYIWSHQETKDLKSHALSAIDVILNEMVQENPEDKIYIQQIDLGKKKVLIERSDHLVGYMIVSASDPTVNIGLRHVLIQLEKIWMNKNHQSNTALNIEDFKQILRRSFTFAIAANKII